MVSPSGFGMSPFQMMPMMGASPMGFSGSPMASPGMGMASPFGFGQNMAQPGGGMGQGDPAQMMFQMMGMMMMMMMSFMMMLMSMLQQSGQSPGSPGGLADMNVPGERLGNGGGGGGEGGGGGNFAALSDRAVPTTLESMNVGNNADLRNSLAAIAEDPDGARLLEAVQAKGIRIRVGDPGGPEVQGLFTGNEIIVRDPRNVKTLVHEMVHAATNGDGNSKSEEGRADVIGTRVARRIAQKEGLDPGSIGAREGSDQHIFETKKQVDGYRGLSEENGSRQTLAHLGVQVNV